MLFTTKKMFYIGLIFTLMTGFEIFAQQIPGDVRIENSAKIDELLTLKKEYNKKNGEFKGFKIQLFYGNEKEAYEIKKEFEAIFPDITTSIIFSSPEWKVQVGNYLTRLQADRSLVEIKKRISQCHHIRYRN